MNLHLATRATLSVALAAGAVVLAGAAASADGGACPGTADWTRVTDVPAGTASVRVTAPEGTGIVETCVSTGTDPQLYAYDPATSTAVIAPVGVPAPGEPALEVVEYAYRVITLDPVAPEPAPPTPTPPPTPPAPTPPATAHVPAPCPQPRPAAPAASSTPAAATAAPVTPEPLAPEATAEARDATGPARDEAEAAVLYQTTSAGTDVVLRAAGPAAPLDVTKPSRQPAERQAAFAALLLGVGTAAVVTVRRRGGAG